MSLHRFAVTQRLPVPVETAWTFFANPHNLGLITPPDMGFEVIGDVPSEMHAGLIIQHRLRPLLGLPVRWVTEITHVEVRRLFVDEQRLGPYRFWHHQHHFREVEGGTEIRDIVHYDVGFGPLGDLANVIAVRPRLREIFAFRRRVLEQRFGEMPARVR